MKNRRIILIGFILLLINLCTIGVNATSFTDVNSIEDYKAKAYIDYPAEDIIPTESGTIVVSGWYMSNDPNSQIKIYIDDIEQEITSLTREERPDVINAIKGYGTMVENPQPGFKAELDITEIKAGQHTLTLKVISREEKILTTCTRKINIESIYKAKTYIDNPAEISIPTVKEIMEISGWYMSNDIQSQIKIFIDGKEQEIIKLTREKRQDVINAIQGYGTIAENPQPGYICEIDISNIRNGKHTLEIEILSRTGEKLATNTRQINIENYSAKIYIDKTEILKENDIENTVIVNGWVMTDDTDSQIKLYIDGNEHNILEIERFMRQDVINAIKGYGGSEQNHTPGFLLKFDISDIKDGRHEVILKIISRNGDELTTISTSIVVQKYKASLYLEKPESLEVVKPIITISGWLMSTDEKTTINVYIDNNKQTIQNIRRTERLDVNNTIKGYGGNDINPSPGYEILLNLSGISEGIHNLKVEAVSQEGTIMATVNQNINIENYKANVYIDSINEFTKDALSEKLTISGWLMTDDDNTQFKVYINNKEINIENVTRNERDDVLNAIKGYGDTTINSTPGYDITIDIKDIKDGKYTLRVDIVSKTGEVIANTSKDIVVDKYKARAYIDIPKTLSQFKSKLIVSGWIMTTDEKANINMYINNKKVNLTEITRTERLDVINSINGYGGVELNPTPGYDTQIDISQYEDGKYVLKVELVSREGEILYAEEKTIVIYNSYNFGIDVSKWNGNINWSQVKESGIDFAIIRAGFRGYGTEGTLVEDTTFEYNMREAIKNGIEVGVYFYSQAINEVEAIQEAQMTLDIIRKYGFSNDITYPIIIDVEASSGRGDNISKEQRTLVIKAFCEKIKQEGYKPMLYSNKNWLEEYIDMSQLGEYDVWLAHYTGTEDPINNPSNYSGVYHIWQYTSKGSIIGINGNVDINIAYKKYFK